MRKYIFFLIIGIILILYYYHIFFKNTLKYNIPKTRKNKKKLIKKYRQNSTYTENSDNSNINSSIIKNEESNNSFKFTDSANSNNNKNNDDATFDFTLNSNNNLNLDNESKFTSDNNSLLNML